MSSLTLASRLSTITVAISLSTLASLPAHADAPPIKPGLWEVANEGQLVNGQPMPDMSAQMAEQMKKMPPEMRKQMEAHMKAQGMQMTSKGGKTTVRVCLTKAMLDENRWQQEQGGCKNTAMTRSGTTWNWKFKCNQPPSEGEGKTTFQSSEAYASEMHITTQRQGQPQKVTMKHQARWLGADCGDVKPITPPPATKP